MSIRGASTSRASKTKGVRCWLRLPWSLTHIALFTPERIVSPHPCSPNAASVCFHISSCCSHLTQFALRRPRVYFACRNGPRTRARAHGRREGIYRDGSRAHRKRALAGHRTCGPSPRHREGVHVRPCAPASLSRSGRPRGRARVARGCRAHAAGLGRGP